MKTLPHAVIALALFGAGILGGRSLTSAAAEGAGHNITTGEPESSSRSGGGSPGPGGGSGERKNLKALQARREVDSRAPGALRSSLERVDTAALRTIALEQYTILAVMTAGGKERKAHQDLYSAAIDELWGRRGLATLEWADGLENPKERAMMLKSLLRRALKDDPASAMPWMERYHAERGKSATIDEFLSIAMRGAVERSADEVIRAHGMFDGSNNPDPLRGASYPDDFDFAKLHASLAGKVDLGGAISRWAVQDRDAAAAAVTNAILETGDRQYYHAESLRAVMDAAIARDGEAAGMEWTVAQLSSLSPEQRREYLWQVGRRSEFSIERVATTVTSLPEQERGEYVLGLLSASDAANSYTALDTLPREELLKVLHKDLFSAGENPDHPMAASLYSLESIRKEVHARYRLTPEEISHITAGAR